MIFLLIDRKYEQPFFLESEFLKKRVPYQILDIPNFTPLDRTVKARVIILYLKYLTLAMRSILKSSQKDVIICWNFTISIAAGLISKIFFINRKIIGLNLIAFKENRKIIERSLYFLYHTIMNKRKFYATANSAVDILNYTKKFQIPSNKFFLLNDGIQSKISTNTNEMVFNSYVLSGGEAKRDWKTLFKAAERLLNIKFICIARKKTYDHSLKPPKNVQVLFDLKTEVFYDYVNQASIIVITLDTKGPVGMTLLLNCALRKKPIIATKTPSMQNYIIDSYGGYLVEIHNPIELALKIEKLYNNKDLQIKFANNLNRKVIEEYSTEKYVENLLEIVEKI